MESRSSPALPPSPALAWASPVRSVPPHHSWTPAAPPAVPEQPAARPPVAVSCRDIIPIIPTAMARSQMWAEGRGQERVPRTLAWGHVPVRTLWLHTGTCMPMDVSTNTTLSDMLSTRVWPGHHDWHVVCARKHLCAFQMRACTAICTPKWAADTPVLVPACTK